MSTFSFGGFSSSIRTSGKQQPNPRQIVCCVLGVDLDGTSAVCFNMTTDLAPFNPSCDHAIDVAIGLLELSPEDILVDIGCGDGRLLITAAQRVHRIRCIGVEHNEALHQRAISALATTLSESQQARVEIRHGDAASLYDILETTCTKLYLYLLPKGLIAIRPALERLRPNVYVVTYMFQIHGWTPIKVDRTTKGSAPVYLYITQ